MRFLAAGLVVMTILVCDFLTDTHIWKISDNASKGWSLTATIALIAFAFLLWDGDNA